MAREAKEFDAEALAAKPVSPLQAHLIDWIKAKTGITFSTKKEEAAWELGVKHAVNFRTYHQASEENQERLAEAKAAAEEEAAPAPAKKATKATKAAPAKKAPAKKAAPVMEEAAEPAPATPKKKVKPGAKGVVKAAADAPF